MSELYARFALRRGAFDLDVELRAPDRGITGISGPSGAGKTTILRCAAGLERAEQGTLRVNGESWQDADTFLPPHRRPIGYVFQEASLFPHLDVRRNLAYGHRRVPAAERRIGLDQVVDLLGIGHLMDRTTEGLSGGERQRVAIARALATSPRLLLMDEPLASLDARSRRAILPILESLHRELAIPVLYVSHALSEVSRLADHVVWVEAGRVRAAGGPNDVLTRLDLHAESDEDVSAVLETVVVEHDEAYALTTLDGPSGHLFVGRLDLPPGAPVRVRILARDVSLGLEEERKSSILNAFPAEVESVEEARPGQVLVRLRCGGAHVLARITRKSCDELGIAPGVDVFARVKSVSLLD